MYIDKICKDDRKALSQGKYVGHEVSYPQNARWRRGGGVDGESISDHKSMDSDHDSDREDTMAANMRPKTTKFTPNHTRNCGFSGTSWEHRKPPTELEALEALEELQGLLRPRREPGKGKKQSESKGLWSQASEQAAAALNQKSKNAPKTLRDHARKFISTKKPPENSYGTWTKARIDADKEFAQEINLFLQSKGKYVKANDISVFLNDKEIQKKWELLKKTIGKATAKWWMKKLGYIWVRNHKGQYVDGHEHEDVVDYRQKFYLPKWYELQPRM
ncbi:hypothetical protein CPB84DRAFT_1751214 [Gymnopilus junonius]|uniref:Uncharacterized protein n=1 Tax=Gymnopilus junonius TaxID=109634 RepID=A0A9P5TJ29_GYMJU|nr:hypothetical protein CPB84DRAFT_1751214 [Gymnopilus junonius]